MADEWTSNRMVPAIQYEAMRQERDGWKATVEIMALPFYKRWRVLWARREGRKRLG